LNFGQHIEILWKKSPKHVLGSDTDPGSAGYGSSRHALETDPDPDPAK
jgi:hypothetical protein